MTYDIAVDALAERIPSRWRALPFRRLASLVDSINAKSTATLLSLASTGVLAPREEFDGLGRQAPSEETVERYWLTQPGNLVVNPMWLVGGGIGVSGLAGAVSPDYRVYRLGPDLHPRYVHHLLRSQPYRDQYKLYTRAETTFDRRVSKVDFHAMPVLVPPLDEQRRIADFLDAETALIDLLSESRRKQLAMIAEHDAAEVRSTVCGATLGSPMRRSGLDWLDNIAEEFRTAAVSHEFEVALGKMLNPERTQGDHLRPYLRNTNVQWDHIDTDDLLFMNFPPGERTRYQVRPGDLLVCEGGDPGRAAIWNDSVKEVYYQKALHRVRPRGESTVRWLYYCLRAATYLKVFAVQGNSTTIAHLTGEQLKAQRFPFPSRAIQDQLVNALDERTEHRRKFEAATNRQLALLAERRQALITAAVTGQIDVTTARGLSPSGGVAV